MVRKEIVLLALCWTPACLAAVSGVIQLNSLTLNKTLGAFPFSFVKFDTKNSDDTAENPFQVLAQELVREEKIVLAQVGIPGFGDPENHDLSVRFQLNQGMLPEYILFKRKGKDFDLTRYGSDLQVDELRQFLQHKTGIWMGLPGCVKELDQLAHAFVRKAGGNKDLQTEVIAQTEELLVKIKGKDKVHRAKQYLKIMKSAHASNDVEYITGEAARLKRLLTGKNLSKEKTTQLELNLNILMSFLSHSRTKDEL